VLAGAALGRMPVLNAGGPQAFVRRTDPVRQAALGVAVVPHAPALSREGSRGTN